MNKGLETIEAQWLFGVSQDKIKILIHPQAVVHSMVEFLDGSILAQMGATDMKAPILCALAYPERVDAPSLRIDLTHLGDLNFFEPDREKFPCLSMAQEVARECDSTLPAVLNAADEVGVNAFLNDRIDFTEIPNLIREVLSRHQTVRRPTLDQILEADRWCRQTAEKYIQREVSERAFSEKGARA